MSKVVIRYASSDDDVIHIHQFLCVVAAPTLPGPIGPKESIEEIWRVTHQDVALMAMSGENLIGTIGLACPSMWWNQKIKYLANRWAFVRPGTGAWRPLLNEARAIGRASKMEVHIISEARGTIMILNRSKLRDRQSPSLANSPNMRSAAET